MKSSLENCKKSYVNIEIKNHAFQSVWDFDSRNASDCRRTGFGLSGSAKDLSTNQNSLLISSLKESCNRKNNPIQFDSLNSPHHTCYAHIVFSGSFPDDYNRA